MCVRRQGLENAESRSFASTDHGESHIFIKGIGIEGRDLDDPWDPLSTSFQELCVKVREKPQAVVFTVGLTLYN